METNKGINMKHCESCGGGPLALNVIPVYRDRKIGIEGVVLKDAVWAETCPKCGHQDDEVIIPNLPGLVAAVAIARVKLPVKLKGRDIRFLRWAMELTGRNLAKKLEVAAETISRWENDHDPINPASEKLLRLLVGVHLAERAPMVPFIAKDIDTMRITFRPTTETLEMWFVAVPAEQTATEPQGRVWVRAAAA